MKKLTREQMIDELLRCVEDWDIDDLIDRVKSNLVAAYDERSDAEIFEEYESYCLGDEE